MKIAFIVVSAIAGILSLVISLPIPIHELDRWPRLIWIERNRFRLALAAIVLGVLCGVLAIMDTRREERPVQTTSGPNGQLDAKMTVDVLRQEVEGRAKRNSTAAIDFFESGDLLMEARDFSAAASAYRSSAEQVPTKAALTNLALCARSSHDLVAALDAGRRAVALPETSGAGQIAHAMALLELGITLADMGKRDEARTYLVDAIGRFRGCREDVGLGSAEYALGVFEYRGGRTAEAIRLLSSASKRFARLREPAGEASALNVLGVASLEAGSTSQGMSALNEAVRLYRRSGDQTGEAGALLNIGSARQDRCELDAALSAYGQSAAAAERIKDKLIRAMALTSAASALIQRGDSKTAEQGARVALQVSQETSSPEDDAGAHLTLATALRLQGRIEEATSEISMARAQFEGVSAVGSLTAMIEGACIATRAGRYNEARALLDEAEAAAFSGGYVLYRASVIASRADLWEAQGDKTKALGMLQTADQLNKKHAIANCVARNVEARLQAANN